MSTAGDEMIGTRNEVWPCLCYCCSAIPAARGMGGWKEYCVSGPCNAAFKFWGHRRLRSI